MISIIIPALDEAEHLPCLFVDLRAGDAAAEIIVVDGGSTDGTAAAASRHGASVLRSEAGRGGQLNRGAEAAGGDVLLFLHADTLLPRGFDEHVRRALRLPGVVAGAFRLRTDSTQASLRLVEWAVQWRSRVLRMPYGDQAIFLGRRVFDEVGGFPEISAMEDFELVRRLRRRGRIEIAPASVVTSARRWRACGVVRMTLLNQVCILAYLLGVRGDRIAGWRRRFGASEQAPRPAVRACASHGHTAP